MNIGKINENQDNYYSNDLLMWAKVRNIEINWPNIFPINSVKAMRGCLSFKDLNEQKTYKKIFESYWKEGLIFQILTI